MKTQKIKKLVMLSTLIFSILSINIVDVFASPPGYHEETYSWCDCDGYDVPVTNPHNGWGWTQVGTSSSGYWGICGACGGPGTTYFYEKGYDCSKCGHVKTGEKRYFDCTVGGDHEAVIYDNGYASSCDGSYHVQRCGGHDVANTYTVYYRVSNPSDGENGSHSHGATYDSSFSLYSGSGFYKTWTVNFLGNTGYASTIGTSTSRTSTASIVSWSGGRGLGAYGKWNFTTTNHGSYTLYANFGSFSQVTIPAVTREGYTLLGYTKDSSKAGVKMDGSTADVQKRVGDKIVPSVNNEKWYAIWKPNEYTIQFNGNGAKYDSTHSTSISGKLFNEFYTSTTDNTKVIGNTPSITVKFDGKIQFPTNGFSKSGKGYYGQTLNYKFIGWSQSAFSNYNSNSRTSYTTNNRTTLNYFGYVHKTTLMQIGYGTYNSGTKTTNSLYFYPNETINNYMYNGHVRHYNLSKGGTTETLYANWIAENQRPYTYFRLATKQYNEDGTWNGKIQDIAYDSDPTTIYDYDLNNKVNVYDDMPIYLDTMYYDPEGRTADGQFTIEYQYSLDGGTTWYQLQENLSNEYFTTRLVTMTQANLNDSKNLDNTYVIDNSKARNIIFGNNRTNTSTTIYMLEINFKNNNQKEILIRNRAADTVDYPLMYSTATRNESNNTLASGTQITLQKTLWSTGYYSKSYSTTNINGTNINEYTGTTNSSGQKAFIQNTSAGKTSGDNAGWYTKTIICHPGNSTETKDIVIADFDNLSTMTYPMYDWINNKSYILVSKVDERDIIDQYGSINVANTLKYRGYEKTLADGTKVDWLSKYSNITTLIRESLSDTNQDNYLHRKYVKEISADESIGFINLSVDKDSYKHYTISANPTYNIDNAYAKKYFNTGDSKSIVQYDNQFSLYWIAIYDAKGNEVLTQASANTNASFDANGIPINGSLYTMPKSKTGLSTDLTGHVYTSYANMKSDIYNRVSATFSEYSDLLNGTYTVYIGVCDKSWNLYSPNKWSIERSQLVVSPRLSFYDIGITDFKQPNYKNEDKVQTLWLRTNSNKQIITYTSGNITYTFPMYKLSGLTTYQTVNGYKQYITNFALTQKQQKYQLNTNYVLDNSLGYTINPTYKIQAGYNFTINTNIQGADYSELAIYDVKNPSVPIQVIQKDFDMIENKNGTNVLMCYTNRQNGLSVYELCFPEQFTAGSKYYAVLTVRKTTLTNATHPLSTTNNGTTTLTRTYQFGSTTNPLFEIDDTMLNDIGVDITN